MIVDIHMPSASTLIKHHGLDKNGDVQKFFTQMICGRMTRYMPASSATGVLSTKKKYVKSSTEIEVAGPYAKYQYFGKVMIDPQINAAGFMTPEGWRSRKNSVKILTNRDIQYNRTFHPSAGPYWDKALLAAEGKAMAADLQRYLNRR